MKRFTRRQVLYLILLFIVIVFLLPIKIPYRFEATAVVFPLKEWYLTKGQDDSYISELRNFQTDVLSNLKSYKFNRGDISEVIMKKDLQTGTPVEAGDTIAEIHSFFISNELSRVHNELAIEQSALKVESSGQKQEVIDQAFQEYTRATQQFDLEEKRFLRQKKLYTDSIIASERFEEAENAYKLAGINIEITRQAMLSAKSGGKPENIQLILQRIEALRHEIRTLEELKAQYIIVPPISGLASYNHQENEIISICDTSGFILKIPVRLKDLRYLNQIKSIRFSIPGRSQEVDAEFISVEGNVQYMDNRQMALAKALIRDGHPSVYPGMTVKCKVVCDKISLFNYMKRGLKINF